jgi:microcystin-dependent protein
MNARRVWKVFGVLVYMGLGGAATSAATASCGSVETACAQETCPAGPQGPQGEQGPQGIAGPKGDPGSEPAGTIVAFAGTSAPPGWLLCDGSEVSRTQYAALFAVVGDLYGNGDQTSTFNLPDLRGRIPVGAGQGGGTSARALAETGGAETVTLTVAQMPKHAHNTHLSGNQTDILATVSGTSRAPGPGIPTIPTLEAGGSQPHENMPPFVVLNYIIKH